MSPEDAGERRNTRAGLGAAGGVASNQYAEAERMGNTATGDRLDDDADREAEHGETAIPGYGEGDEPEAGSGINVNLVMVEDGQAFAYRQYLNRCDAREYLDADDRASRRRYGVWQVEGGITRPWDFRRTRKSQRLPN